MPSTEELATEALASWETNAEYWDAVIGPEGNKYWSVLQEPSLTRLCKKQLKKAECAALDLATGNGLVARWLAINGATTVLATDGSAAMINLARKHIQAMPGRQGNRIATRVLDVTKREAFDELKEALDVNLPNGKAGFDIIIMNMAIMDVATIEPLAQALVRLLVKGGIFVATLLHPVFFTSGASRSIDVRYSPETGEMETDRTMVVRNYLSVPPAKGIAVPGQPQKQIYFHRPMHELFAPFFRAGLVLDALEEPAFTEADSIDERVEATSNYTQIPPILSFRMRLASDENVSESEEDGGDEDDEMEEGVF